MKQRNHHLPTKKVDRRMQEEPSHSSEGGLHLTLLYQGPEEPSHPSANEELIHCATRRDERWRCAMKIETASHTVGAESLGLKLCVSISRYASTSPDILRQHARQNMLQ